MIEKKKNTWIKILIMLIVIIAVGVGAYFIYDYLLDNNENGYNESEYNPSRVNSELKEVINFGIRDYWIDTNRTLQLLAFNESGDEIKIYQWQSETIIDQPYIIVDNKVYIAECLARECFIGVIDLNRGNGNYEIVDRLMEFAIEDFATEGWLEFVVIGNSIYYKTALFADAIYEFNIETEETSRVFELSEGYLNAILSSAEAKVIFYMNQVTISETPSNGGIHREVELNIYMYDIENAQEKRICTNCRPLFTHDGKLIYETSQDRIRHFYEYDIQNNRSIRLTTSPDFGGGIIDQKIIPFEEGYLYLDRTEDFNGTNLYRINIGSENELLYTFEDFFPGNLLLAASNKIMLSESSGGYHYDTIETRIFNLDNHEISMIPNRHYHTARFVNFQN